MNKKMKVLVIGAGAAPGVTSVMVRWALEVRKRVEAEVKIELFNEIGGTPCFA